MTLSRETRRALMRDLVLRGRTTYHADRAWRASWIAIVAVFLALGLLKLFELAVP